MYKAEILALKDIGEGLLITSGGTMALRGSMWLYYNPPWLHLALIDCTTLYHGSTLLYLIALFKYLN